MQITEFTEEPEVMQSFSRPDGTNEIWLRRNIREIEKEDGTVWVADEVMIVTALTAEEVMNQFDSYFVPDPVPTQEHIQSIIDYNLMMGNLEDPEEEDEDE